MPTPRLRQRHAGGEAAGGEEIVRRHGDDFARREHAGGQGSRTRRGSAGADDDGAPTTRRAVSRNAVLIAVLALGVGQRPLQRGEHGREVAIGGGDGAGLLRCGPRRARAAPARGPGRAGPPPGGRRESRAGACPPSCAARSRPRRGARLELTATCPDAASPTRATKNRSVCSRESLWRCGPRRRASRRAPSPGRPSPRRARLQPHAIRRARDLDAPLGSAARGADRGALGRARSAALALGAEGAGSAHARVTRAGPSASARPGPRPRRAKRSSLRRWSADQELVQRLRHPVAVGAGQGHGRAWACFLGWTPVRTWYSTADIA